MDGTREDDSVLKAFEKVLEVRWSDVDFNGHLRNTGYSDYANHAQACFF